MVRPLVLSTRNNRKTGRFLSNPPRAFLLGIGLTTALFQVISFLSIQHWNAKFLGDCGSDSHENDDGGLATKLQNFNPRQLRARAAKGSASASAASTLEYLSQQIGTSSSLTSAEKEQLLSTLHHLQLSKAQSKTTGSHDQSPYAYMFVMGGIHEHRPTYKGFLYDVLVATTLLRRFGSTADVVLYLQMSPDSQLGGLPLEDLRKLRALQIKIKPLPAPTHKESFANLVFQKFRALELTEYRRVVFMDADAIPLTNLDYLFHLSDPLHTATPTLLKPNLIMASRGEPCNAGVFMLQPQPGGWDELQEIITRQRELGAKLPYPHFSWEKGWGYDFEAENDIWRGTAKNGKKWRFHAGHSDQGLLYYWTKFHKQHVSIVIQDEIENWIDPSMIGRTAALTVDGKPKPILEKTLKGEPLAAYSTEKPFVSQFACDTINIAGKDKAHQPHQCIVSYRDFAHFMGGNKPWQDKDPKEFLSRIRSQIRYTTDKYNAPKRLWFQTLFQVEDNGLNLETEFTQWHDNHGDKGAPLGDMAKHSDFMADHPIE